MCCQRPGSSMDIVSSAIDFFGRPRSGRSTYESVG